MIGLGNPGSRYAGTRHNVGFDVLDTITERLAVRWKKKLFRPYLYAEQKSLFLVKPLTYMNRSGEILPSVLRKSGLSEENILLICDNLDLKPGSCRLKMKGGTAGHKGLKSVLDTVGTERIMRLYIGIGKPAKKDEVVDYVLRKPLNHERALYDGAIRRAADAVMSLQTNSPTQVMNEINSR